MKTIYKYQITLSGKVDMPVGAKVLHVGEQDGGMFLWAAVDTRSPIRHRQFTVIGTGTGWDMEEKDCHVSDYVGTVMALGLVWHIFEG